MGYVEDVSPGWEQRKKWKSFLVSFWGSIISPHAIRGVPGSLPVFCEQLTFVCLSSAMWKGEYGLGFGGVLTKTSRKVRSPYQESLWRNLACMLVSPWANTTKRILKQVLYELYWHKLCRKSDWKVNVVFFCFKSVSCMIFVSWPLISCIYIVSDPLFQCFENTRLWGKWALNKASTHVGWSITAVQ